MEKMTNAKALYFVLNNYEEMPEDVRLKLESMVATLEKKSANRKPTKTQAENENYKAIILEVLTSEGMTASEVLASSDEFEGMSNQKISALLNLMVKAHTIRKFTDKKKTFFATL